MTSAALGSPIITTYNSLGPWTPITMPLPDVRGAAGTGDQHHRTRRYRLGANGPQHGGEVGQNARRPHQHDIDRRINETERGRAGIATSAKVPVEAIA